MAADSSHLFILGYGYCAQHLVRHDAHRFQCITVTTRSAQKAEILRKQKLDAHLFDASTGAITPDLVLAMQAATHILVCVPPDALGDPCVPVLAPVLKQAAHLRCMIYLSTTGVYGDHQGGWVDESTPLTPSGERGRRRVQAEQQWQQLAEAMGAPLWLFRLGGIYGPGRNVLEQLCAGKARRIVKPGQVFNRIHVEDVVRAILVAFAKLERAGALNIVDDEPAPPQDIVTFAAALLGVLPPPEVAFVDAALSSIAASFYDDNKRVANNALKNSLGLKMTYPSYDEGLRSLMIP